MNELWQDLADCLRVEVTEYGRLFQLHEEQQLLLFRRNAAGVVRVTNSIDEQVAILVRCRRSRENSTVDFARAMGLAESSTLGAMIAHVPEDARPLVHALVSEMNRLVGRLRRISRHNRLFLIRTIENHQELLRRFRPGSFTKIYAPNGRVTVSTNRRATALAGEG